MANYAKAPSIQPGWLGKKRAVSASPRQMYEAQLKTTHKENPKFWNMMLQQAKKFLNGSS